MDEFLIRYRILVNVVHQEGVALWCDIQVNDGLSTSAVNSDIASAIDGTIECVLTKVREVIGKQILCMDVQVVCQMSEVVVVNTSCDDTLMVADVVDGATDEFYLVGHHTDSIVT